MTEENVKNPLNFKKRRGKPKTKILEESLGGKWRYTGFGGGWRCDDQDRYVVQCYSCTDDDIVFEKHYPRFYIYNKEGVCKRIVFGFDEVIVF